MQNQNALGEIILPSQSTSAIPIVAPPTDNGTGPSTPKSPTLKNSVATKRMSSLSLSANDGVYQIQSDTPMQRFAFLLHISFYFWETTLSQYYYPWIL